MSTTLSCPSCSDPILEAQRFCPSCGASLDFSETPTGTAPRPRSPSPARAGSDRAGSGPRTPGGAIYRTPGGTAHAAGVSGAAAQGRFLPGTLLVDRYRIVGLLGKGGMGEVYRADDLKLEQPVALKFLPAGFEADRERLERFYNEIRMARQVSHPAVCRVYDIGEVEGEHFLSMEYVDGENLASLQRRIGRLAADKAMDIALQLCAGVAAAHEKGVLHRDLKPDNVMLDGQGKVRITDFGLAGLEDTIRGDDVRSGTPAYMAPEQLAGQDVTARSDVYSLGLVLYELFTGKRAFEGKSFAELLKKHRDELPIEPSLLVPDLSPAVERTILRCLEKDPARRAPSARAAAVLLAGGDPLAAAIAAGETPSPELVASAGEAEGLRPRVAALCLGVVLLAMLMAPFMQRLRGLLDRVPVEKSPAALEDRARELVTRLGHAARATDSEIGFAFDFEYFRFVAANDASPGRWNGLATGHPAVLNFYYRQSPQPLASTALSGEVSWRNPPLIHAGMAGVRFDLRGHLVEFYAIPPQVETASDATEAVAAKPDWSVLFAEARLDPSTLRPVTPLWTPPFYCDERAAWEGTYPDRPDIPIRVEAAGYRGRPVSFSIVHPWKRPERMLPHQVTPRERVALFLVAALALTLLAAGAVLARRNVRLGRGDRRGAFRLALFVFGLGLFTLALVAHHMADLVAELALMSRGTAGALLLAAINWLFYLALEPYVRRLRPRTLVSWTRVLGGGFRDAAVGQDVLIGAAWGGLVMLVLATGYSLPQWLGRGSTAPWFTDYDAFLGTGRLIALLAGLLIDSVHLGMGCLLLYLLLRLLIRNDMGATAVLVVLMSGVQAAGSLWEFDSLLPLLLLVSLVVMGSYAFLLLRFGLLSAIAGIYVLKLLMQFPLSTDVGSWRGTPTIFLMVVLGALVVAAFRVSLKPGSRSLLSD